ncbi:hypothetical protein BpHYR1_031877, partial [Brachionus plicatilis]
EVKLSQVCYDEDLLPHDDTETLNDQDDFTFAEDSESLFTDQSIISSICESSLTLNENTNIDQDSYGFESFNSSQSNSVNFFKNFCFKINCGTSQFLIKLWIRKVWKCGEYLFYYFESTKFSEL